jgi:hypothetical protein
MIPFGPWHPDLVGVNVQAVSEARNVLPAQSGFLPVRSMVSMTDPIDSRCFGAATLLRKSGGNVQFCASRTKLYRLQQGTWQDVSGQVYATSPGERWRFASWGETIIGTNYADAPQFYDTEIVSGALFGPLPGSPPSARYITTVRDVFVLLGGIKGYEKRVQWSGLNNSNFWTPGLQSSDFQDAQAGGPVRGVIGGATGWVWQSDRCTRMTFTPGSTNIFQFDEAQGAKGLAAPDSLVKVGDMAYYMASDGFYQFSLSSGAQKPIGVNKWRKFFQNDIRASTQLLVLGAADPLNTVVMWAYVSKGNSATTPNRILFYDWSLDEASFADIPVEAISSWLTPDANLDQMSQYGNLDTLPFSLDSPFWKGSFGIMGLFGLDHALAFSQGSNMAATFTTADGETATRNFITGTRPMVDTSLATVAISTRERDGDVVTFNTFESMEDTGIVPAHGSGNIARAQVVIPVGANWTLMQGLQTQNKVRGRR